MSGWPEVRFHIKVAKHIFELGCLTLFRILEQSGARHSDLHKKLHLATLTASIFDPQSLISRYLKRYRESAAPGSEDVMSEADPMSMFHHGRTCGHRQIQGGSCLDLVRSGPWIWPGPGQVWENPSF